MTATPVDWRYFDETVGLPFRSEEGTGVWHASRTGAEWALKLLRSGGPDATKQAEQLLAAVARCQDRDEASPHRGNYRWEYEDGAVEDLNAVSFVLINLCPIALEFADVLSAATRDDLALSIRLGLEEVDRIDVSLDYTNIVLKDIVNTALGAQFLGDGHFRLRAAGKLRDFCRKARIEGGATELNSPEYTPVAINVLSLLARLADDPDIACRARTLSNRIALSYALRLHPGIDRLAGPYSRAYHEHLTRPPDAERRYLAQLVAAGALPAWFAGYVEPQDLPLFIREQHRGGLLYSSWLGRTTSLGTASKEMDWQAIRFIQFQSNVMVANLAGPAGHDHVVHTRYLTDGKRLGDFRTSLSRPKGQLLPEEGRFLGIQNGPRSLGIYCGAELGARQPCCSARMQLTISNADDVVAVWADGRLVEQFPHELTPTSTIAVQFAGGFLTVRLLAVTALGSTMPVRLNRSDGELRLEAYNYDGPVKTFWELADPGSFYQGKAIVAFLAEVQDRAAEVTLAGIGSAAALRTVDVRIDPPPRHDGRTRERLFRVDAPDERHPLAAKVDLMSWRMLASAPDFPAPDALLVSNKAVQRAEGTVRLGAVSASSSGPAGLWIAAHRAHGGWTVGGAADEPVRLTIGSPDGRIEVEAFQFGNVTFDGRQTSFDLNVGARPLHPFLEDAK